MRLFDFVEQNDRVGFAADRFGQLAAFFEADIAGRRTEQARHRVLLLIFGHVDANHVVLVVEQVFRERAGEFGLADACGAEEDETADRAIGIFQAGTGADDGLGDSDDRFVLADDTLVQLVFKMQQLLHFAFEQTRDRHTGPAADDRGDILLADFFFEKLRRARGYRFRRWRALRSVRAALPYLSSAARLRS